MKLLALAHTLEVAAHGSAHLREHPPPQRMAPKHKTRARELPGWGNVPNPQDWAVIDEVPDSENAGAVQGSRISQQAQELQLDSGLVDDTEQHTEQAEDDSEEEDGAEAEDGGWEVAARTSNARRRK
jgi:RNA-binding protein NOB1